MLNLLRSGTACAVSFGSVCFVGLVYLTLGRGYTVTVKQTLPLCMDLKREFPGLEKGWFLTRDRGRWVRQLSDNTARYELETCVLKRFTAEEARVCLSDRPMLFVGDSVMRYQYVSLVYFLHTGEWPARRDGMRERVGDMGSVVWEGAWKNWARYYVDVPDRVFKGAEWCDCYRGALVNGTNNENRFYYDPAHGVKVSLVFQFGNASIPAHFPPPFNPALKPGRYYAMEADMADAKQRPYDFNGNLTDYLKHPRMLAWLNDTKILRWGMGIRGGWSEAQSAEWYAFGYNFTRDRGGISVYTGTTAPLGIYDAPHRDLLNTIARAGWELFDLTHVTKSLRWLHWDGAGAPALRRKPRAQPGCCGEPEYFVYFVDWVHLQPFVYEEMNNLYLNQLC